HSNARRRYSDDERFKLDIGWSPKSQISRERGIQFWCRGNLDDCGGPGRGQLCRDLRRDGPISLTLVAMVSSHGKFSANRARSMHGDAVLRNYPSVLSVWEWSVGLRHFMIAAAMAWAAAAPAAAAPVAASPNAIG